MSFYPGWLYRLLTGVLALVVFTACVRPNPKASLSSLEDEDRNDEDEDEEGNNPIEKQLEALSSGLLCPRWKLPATDPTAARHRAGRHGHPPRRLFTPRTDCSLQRSRLLLRLQI